MICTNILQCTQYTDACIWNNCVVMTKPDDKQSQTPYTDRYKI